MVTVEDGVDAPVETPEVVDPDPEVVGVPDLGVTVETVEDVDGTDLSDADALEAPELRVVVVTDGSGIRRARVDGGAEGGGAAGDGLSSSLLDFSA